MGTGYIRLWREIEEHSIWQDPELLKLFLWLVLRAAHKPTAVMARTGKGETLVKLRRGQLLVGRKTLAAKFDCPPSTILRRLRRLVELESISIQADTHYSIVSVVNYRRFQKPTKKSGHPTDTQRTPNNGFLRHPINSGSIRESTEETQNELFEVDTQRTPNNEKSGHKERMQEDLKKGGRTRLKFVHPSFEEVRDHIIETNSPVDPEAFFHFYEANGWKQSNGRPIVKWQSAVVTWAKRQSSFATIGPQPINGRKAKVLA